MNKADLINVCAVKTNDNKIDAERYINAVIEAITEALVNGDDVKLIGFGKFEVKTHKSRIGRNPKNPKETYEVPATKAVKFTAGECLKKAINK